MFLKCLLLLLITFNATYAFANNKKNYLTNQTTIDILEKNFTTYKLVGEAKYTYFLLFLQNRHRDANDRRLQNKTLFHDSFYPIILLMSDWCDYFLNRRKM